VPGAPDAPGSIFTRSSASFTPRGLSGWASVMACRIVRATSQFTTATHDFDGAVDQPPLECVAEDHVERVRQIVATVLRIALRQQEIHQVADLDWFGGALVGHAISRGQTDYN
jgi:hypothetical protein